jgi:exopolysaccharide biosynthesis protein
MKKSSTFFLFISATLILFLIFSYIFKINLENNYSTPPSSEETKNIENQRNINYSGIDYTINWFVLESSETLSIHSNLINTARSTEAKENHSCKFLVNGGFYDQDNNHLGLLIENNELISKSISSETFNSFFVIDADLSVNILENEPELPVEIALQTGPMLIKDNQSINLELTSDKYARRVVVGLNGENEIVFIIIYDSKTKISGPLLSNLPDIIELFEEKSGIDVVSATNLDGGGASAFLTKEVSITENQIIGSYFCVK